MNMKNDIKKIIDAGSEAMKKLDPNFIYIPPCHWISVDDHMPYQNQKVIIFDGDSYFAAEYNPGFKEGSMSYKHSDFVTTLCACCNRIDKITHWMPLPELPKD